MVQLNSDLSSQTTMDSFDPLPPGLYHVGIVGSEIRQTRSGNSMLSLAYEVLDGPHQGRKVFDNLNLWHSSVQAVEIASRTLKTIATVTGHRNPNFIGDSSELHGLDMIVRLAIRKDDTGNDYQDVKGYRSARETSPGGASAAPGPGSVPVPPPAAGTPASPPPPQSGPGADPRRKPWE